MLFDKTFSYTLEEQQRIQELRKLVEDCPDLEIGTEDVLLSKYLYPHNWQVEKAFEALQKHFDFKSRHPDYAIPKPLECYRDLYFESKAKSLMSKPDKDGRLIFILDGDFYDRYPSSIFECIQLDEYIFECLWLLPRVQKYGLTIIHDFTHAGTSLLKFSPKVAKLSGQRSAVLPFTPSPVHGIRKGAFWNVVINAALSFCSKEFKKSFILHDANNLSKFHDMLGYENVPARFGGPPENVCDHNLLYNFMEENSDYINKLRTYRKVSR